MTAQPGRSVNLRHSPTFCRCIPGSKEEQPAHPRGETRSASSPCCLGAAACESCDPHKIKYDMYLRDHKYLPAFWFAKRASVPALVKVWFRPVVCEFSTVGFCICYCNSSKGIILSSRTYAPWLIGNGRNLLRF